MTHVLERIGDYISPAAAVTCRMGSKGIENSAEDELLDALQIDVRHPQLTPSTIVFRSHLTSIGACNGLDLSLKSCGGDPEQVG